MTSPLSTSNDLSRRGNLTPLHSQEATAMHPPKSVKPIVSFQDVTKSYGNFTVLDHLNLDVTPGEKVAIIGPSGSGKSTLLRVLMTLEGIDDGLIRIEDDLLTHMPNRNGVLVPANDRHIRRVRGKIGMVFQSFNLFPHMTALQNVIEAPVQVLGMKAAEARERAADLLELVGLGSKLGHYPSQLSGGQQQRVAIARALAMRPKVMLFDEVTSALDPELCGEVLNVIRKLGAEHNLTMLMVTHQMGFAREFADRVCFFYKGQIHEQGTPAQIFEHPQQERTCAFLSAVKEAN
ncbi:Glutamine transport ATP-binding protein GlnQ [Pseudomonas fluorescens]|uniref:Glutamine transport ATP-binding protein GlnQ n=2 Tax=Pseudomonas fluorescens TaxID=294 RepID=A0A5E6R6E8_PSEFL|nr:Glutamine transport ATP-binding protein GlnQ [Pseudomonas fluorescens]